MKRIKLVAAVLAACLLLAGPALAQTCNDHIPAVAPDSRYTDHGNGTVTDNATGLMWKQCSEGLYGPGCASGEAQTFGWQGALQHGQDYSFAGFNDWRLPNVNELASLVEERCVNPAINATLFPIPNVFTLFWTSSPVADYSHFAWFVNFTLGDVSHLPRNYNSSVRLVRGGE